MKLTEVILSTHQFETLKVFYGSLLGLDIVVDQPSQLSFQVGSTILGFCEADPKEKPYYHIAFAIPTNKFSEAKQWVSERGIPLFSKDGQDEFSFESWNATALYFYDPDGNLIEFIAHHTLNNATDEAFESKQILRISEIGLPVDNVPETANKLIETFQLSQWGGDGRQFAPIGDAEGALIVVDKHRPWFPDGRTPAVFNTRVTIEGTDSMRISLQNNLYEIRSS
ncbi:VOC family protein [Paenibacillus sp. FA6]|uniref:VOC family protein n=1 Tax=Paenibacillus sp. FA6 TaxID=3413029 RepID=UPI003F65FE3F